MKKSNKVPWEKSHKGDLIYEDRRGPPREKRIAIKTWRMRMSRRKDRGQKRGQTDFPGDPLVENLPTNGGDTASVPAPGRSHVLQGN